jgi:predicted Fe-Mo cluster-binding NifX family protein
MLAGNMGDGAVRVLKANGIEVVRGASGNARAVVDAFLAGAVKDSGEGCHEHGAHDCAH